MICGADFLTSAGPVEGDEARALALSTPVPLAAESGDAAKLSEGTTGLKVDRRFILGKK